MTSRFRIRFTGPVAPGIVHWLQALIPVLREAPKDVRVEVEITSTAEPEADSAGRDEAG